jgi:hypothetical protein
MVVKHSKIVILLENRYQHDAAEEKENKIYGFSKNFLFRELVHQNLGNWIRFMLTKVEVHPLSDDLRRNL